MEVLEAGLVDFVNRLDHADVVLIEVLVRSVGGVVRFLAGEGLLEIHDAENALIAVHQDGGLDGKEGGLFGHVPAVPVHVVIIIALCNQIKFVLSYIPSTS